MSSSLPLSVRVAIRENWTNGTVHDTLKTLEELLGHKVAVEPEWQLLVTELDKFYPNKEAVVFMVTGCVKTWAKCLADLLDDSSNEAWTEQILEKAPVTLRVFVDVGTSDKASTRWSDERQGFIISIPKCKVFPLQLFPTFQGDLLGCFQAQKRAPLGHKDTTATVADDWSDVQVDAKTGTAHAQDVPSLAPVPATLQPRSNVEFLPDAASLDRPDQLLLRPPYHLSMTSAGYKNIELHCSHSPSLQVLADYLKRWCRVNHNDTTKPPGVQITLHQCAFGLGEMFDRLTLSTEETRYTNQFQVTTPMVVALVEGVLGYKLVSTQGSVWSFRRDVGFKAL
ncbi:hypothetical protein QBC42DRAFT_274458 [Cladorrhinum samala]|uniref:Uncharacterized protein n=1 Tax=Cladorrhinum samala TaxID=585594 RepID=A0AAV9HHC4_9PEZI|nr:hypothetical protein QBC42DRAFT_274458 [Cladorrhinum samala]